MKRRVLISLSLAVAVLLVGIAAPLPAADSANTVKQEPVIPPLLATDQLQAGLTIDVELPVGSTEPDADLKWAAGDILVSNNDGDWVKPTIAHAANGDLFVVVEDLASEYLRTYISTDDGWSWTPQKWFGSSPDSRNPSIACVEDGAGQRWVFVAYEVRVSDILRDVRVYRYDPDSTAGGTFLHAVDDIPWTQPTQELVPRIVTDSIDYPDDYYLYVTYAIPTIDYYPVFFVQSTDGGDTWGTPDNITGGSENTSASTRPTIAYGHDNLYVAFTKPGWNGASWTKQVWVTRSTNFGATFGTPLQMTTSTYDQSDPSVAAANGTDSVVVGFTGGGPSDTRIYGRSSTDAGVSWGALFLFPYTTDNEGSLALAASDSSPGRFHAVFWRDHDLRYTSTNFTSPTAWAGTVLVNSYNFASLSYPFPAITANPTLGVADEAAMVWSDFRNPEYDAYFNGPVVDLIFADGFESGNVSAWSSSVP